MLKNILSWPNIYFIEIKYNHFIFHNHPAIFVFINWVEWTHENRVKQHLMTNETSL